MSSGVRWRTLVRSTTCHPVIVLQAPDQLPVTDVNRNNAVHPGPQQDVGEATRGRARIEAAPSRDAQWRLSRGESFQGTGELVSASGGVARIVAQNLDRFVGSDPPSRLDAPADRER